MNIVITGSTRGIGRGMAQEFVARGHKVVVSGRRSPAVDAAVVELNKQAAEHATGVACDVADISQVRALWAHATQTFGPVDIWINNAGVTNRKMNLDEIPDEQIQAVTQTNFAGLLNCCKVALDGMKQQGHGKIFNMEGFGSDGLTKPGMSAYGASKVALRYLTKAMVQEYKNTPLIIGYMSPGIVVTDLLLKDLNDQHSEEFENRKWLLNIVADRVETVAPVLVEGALAASKTGAAVRWMSIWRVLGRFIKSRFVKRDVLSSVEST